MVWEMDPLENVMTGTGGTDVLYTFLMFTKHSFVIVDSMSCRNEKLITLNHVKLK